MDEDRSEVSVGITRRQFLVAGVGGGLAWGLASCNPPYRPPHDHDQPTVIRLPFEAKSPTLEPFVDPLPIPPRRPLGGTIRMAEAQHRFHRDLPFARSWGYDGQTHLGPTLEARVDERTETTFVNALGTHVMGPDIDSTLSGVSEEDRLRPPTSVHLHGAPNEPRFDGHPMATFRPGHEVSYIFNNAMPACTLWYHDHAMGTTRLGVYSGLAGQYWVRDAWDTGLPDNPLGLPAGDHELPLSICDKLFYDNGSLRYQGTQLVGRDHWAGGLCGDVILVNGKAWPYLEVDRGVYRFRILNATQLNDYRLTLSNGMPFWVIGSDGGLLDAPVLVAELDVSCGERYDILIDFGELRPGERVVLKNTMQIAWAGQLVGATQVPEVMQFVAKEAQGPYRWVPNRLRGGFRRPPALPAIETPAHVRPMTLLTQVDLRRLRLLTTLVMSMNNLRFDDPGYDIPQQGTTERWDLINADVLGQVHAMHLHLIQFRVVGRHDLDRRRYNRDHPLPPLGQRWSPPADDYLIGPLKPPAPYEAGWKDTVRCPPNTVTHVVVRWPTRDELGFDPDAPYDTPMGDQERGYVWHCHLLDHEDHEMMLRLRVANPGDVDPYAAEIRSTTAPIAGNGPYGQLPEADGA